MFAGFTRIHAAIDIARRLLCGRDDPVSPCQRDPHIRLPSVRDEAARSCARSCGALAAEAGVTIEHIAKSYIRKEEVVAWVLEQRGDHPGLVHVISAMEACEAYQPWHDKQTHKNFVRPDSGKCLHYYFYFLDARFGLIYLRVPTPAQARPSPGQAMGAVPPTILLQWPQLAGTQARREGHRLHHGR